MVAVPRGRVEVTQQPHKLVTWVRFPPPLPRETKYWVISSACHALRNLEATKN